MNRILLIILGAMLFAASAQSQTREENIEYSRKKQKAFVIEFAYPPEAVENALTYRMGKLGYRSSDEKGIFNKNKGFRVFKGARIDDVSDESMDYVMKVERKSRRETQESVVYLILLKDGVNASTVFDATEKEAAMDFLRDLLPDVEDAQLDLQVKEQEELVIKSEKKYNSLSEEQISLEKKIKQLQADLEKNITDQEEQQKDLEIQKKALEALKAKRRIATD